MDKAHKSPFDAKSFSLNILSPPIASLESFLSANDKSILRSRKRLREHNEWREAAKFEHRDQNLKMIMKRII